MLIYENTCPLVWIIAHKIQCLDSMSIDVPTLLIYFLLYATNYYLILKMGWGARHNLVLQSRSIPTFLVHELVLLCYTLWICNQIHTSVVHCSVCSNSYSYEKNWVNIFQSFIISSMVMYISLAQLGRI